ncbi:MAG: diacylglycerol kinase family protein [Spirochaetes bacterium]|nr:diacylglycerol kinase family protein [Spirochaetota bacterium]
MKPVYRAIIHSVCQSVWVTEKGYFPHIIINPYAGTMKNRRKRSYVEHVITETFGIKSYPLDRYEFQLYVTEFAQHGFEIASQIINEIKRDKRKKHLIVVAAGDGTAHELLSNFVSHEKILKNVLFFRLPFGTGNDASDCENIYQALQIQAGYGKVTSQEVLRITTARGKSLYSFNIASLGLDGYVVSLTNTLKKIVPGSFYSLFVDVATLMYEKRYKPQMMRIAVTNGKETVRYDGTYLFVAMGVTGYRTYGDHKKILPDRNNLCFCRPISFIQKILKKSYFFDGRHIMLKNVSMAKGRKMVIEYTDSIPFQTDGEDYLLMPEDFPVTFEILDQEFRVLKHHEPGLSDR